jgi:hypothetical protein
MWPFWPVVFIAGWVYHLVLPLLKAYLPVSEFNYDGLSTQVSLQHVHSIPVQLLGCYRQSYVIHAVMSTVMKLKAPTYCVRTAARCTAACCRNGFRELLVISSCCHGCGAALPPTLRTC